MARAQSSDLLKEFSSSYFRLLNVTDATALNEWILNVSKSMCSTRKQAQQALFFADTSDWMDSLQGAVMEAFRIKTSTIRGRVIEAMLDNDDKKSLKNFLSKITIDFRTPLVEMQGVSEYPVLAYAASVDAIDCVVWLISEYPADQLLRPNEELFRNPFFVAITNNSWRVLKFFLHDTDLDFQREAVIADAANVDILPRTRQMIEDDSPPEQMWKHPFDDEKIQARLEALDGIEKVLHDIQVGNRRRGVPDRILRKYMSRQNAAARILPQLEKSILKSFVGVLDNVRLIREFANSPGYDSLGKSELLYGQVSELLHAVTGDETWERQVRHLEELIDSFEMPQDRFCHQPLPLNIWEEYPRIAFTQCRLKHFVVVTALRTGGEVYMGHAKSLARTAIKMTMTDVKNRVFRILHPPPPVDAAEEKEFAPDHYIRLGENAHARSDVWDLCRGMIIYKSLQGIIGCLIHLKQNSGIEIVNFQNRFRAQPVVEWQDLMMHIRLPYGEKNRPEIDHGKRPITCEIQLCLRELVIARRSLGGHEAYAKFRLANSICELVDKIEEANKLEEVQQEMHEWLAGL